MKVVITGAGNVGRHLATDLATRGHEITLIEQDKAVATRAKLQVPETVNTVLGDACASTTVTLINVTLPELRTVPL